MIGYYDIIEAETKGIVKRTETIDSKTDSLVLYINKNIFNEIFTIDDHAIFRDYYKQHNPDSYDALVKNVQNQEKAKLHEFSTLKSTLRGEKQEKYQKVIANAKQKLAKC